MDVWDLRRPALKLLLLLGLCATTGYGVIVGEGGETPPSKPAGERITPPAHVSAAPGTPSFATLVDSLSWSVDQLSDVPSILPTLGRISSSYTLARPHPLLHVVRPHRGVDIAAPSGTPVVSPAAGIVSFVGSREGYGLMLEIEHDHGIVTLYGHLSRTFVREGQSVVRGQLLGSVGNSGVSTGPHLHYEILVGGTPVDPRAFEP